jgi:hypothetical protein
MRTRVSQQQRDRAWPLARSYSLLVYAALSYYLADGVADQASDGNMHEHACSTFQYLYLCTSKARREPGRRRCGAS